MDAAVVDSGMTASRMSSSPSPTLSSFVQVSDNVVVRKPITGSRLQASVRVVTPSIASITGQSCPFSVRAPLSSIPSAEPVEVPNHQEQEITNGERISSYLSQDKPLPVPEKVFVNLPRCTRPRHKSAPDCIRPKMHTHTRHLSFDPNLAHDRTRRHPHEHGKVTGFRTRGLVFNAQPAVRHGNAEDDIRKPVVLASERQSERVVAQQQRELVTLPKLTHSAFRGDTSVLGSPHSSNVNTRSSGPPVPPKDSSPILNTKSLDPQKRSCTNPPCSYPVSPTSATMRSSSSEYPPDHCIGHASFFDHSDDEETSMKRLRKVMTGMRRFRGSSGDMECALGDYGGEHYTTFSCATRPRRKSNFTQKLRGMVLCGRSEELLMKC